MTCVCSVGLDMIAIPDTPATTIAAMIADEAAIGMINNNDGGADYSAPGRRRGQVNFGGLLGRAPILPVHTRTAAGLSCAAEIFPRPFTASKLTKTKG
ncbi:MAG: DUF711 family protein [Christensenellaceae bacterium]